MNAARTAGTLEVDGRPIAYETEGSGRPIVLLHGGLADNTTWAAQFAGLGRTRRVVAPERQGHGHTPDAPGPLTYQAMADETLAVLTALDLGPVDLLGWSDGGMVGLLLAAQHPGAVRTLSVTGTGFASTGYVPGAIEALTALPLDDPELAPFAAMHARASPDGAAHFGVLWAKVRALWAEPFDWSGDLGRITAPLLVIVGDDDYVRVGHAETLARSVRAGQLAVVPGASHLVPIEKPELFNRLVLEFTAGPAVSTMTALWRAPPP